MQPNSIRNNPAPLNNTNREQPNITNAHKDQESNLTTINLSQLYQILNQFQQDILQNIQTQMQEIKDQIRTNADNINTLSREIDIQWS